jgi:fumarate reductase subunit C
MAVAMFTFKTTIKARTTKVLAVNDIIFINMITIISELLGKQQNYSCTPAFIIIINNDKHKQHHHHHQHWWSQLLFNCTFQYD